MTTVAFTSLAARHFVPLQANPVGLLGRFAFSDFAFHALILSHFLLERAMKRLECRFLPKLYYLI